MGFSTFSQIYFAAARIIPNGRVNNVINIPLNIIIYTVSNFVTVQLGIYHQPNSSNPNIRRQIFLSVINERAGRGPQSGSVVVRQKQHEKTGKLPVPELRHFAYLADNRVHSQSLPIFIRPQHPNERLNINHISRLQICEVAPYRFGKFQKARIGFPGKF